MSKIAMRLWGVFYVILFHCARLTFWIFRPRIRGTMVAIWNGGRILLVQSSYRKGWCLPGGLARKSETLAQAAAREAREEVGIHLKAEDLVQVGKAPGDLGPHDVSNLFEVELEGPVEINVDGREIVHGEFFTPRDALHHTLNANVRNYLLSHIGSG